MVIRSPWPSMVRYSQQPIWQHLEATARRLPEKPALIEATGRVTSFGDLWDASRAVAGLLQARAGVTRGDIVAVTTEDSRELVAAMYGALIAGAAIGPVSPLFRAKEVADRLDSLKAHVAVVSSASRPTFEAARLASSDVALAHTLDLDDLWSRALTDRREPRGVPIDADTDFALVGYTSGTGGLSKPVAHTHLNETASVAQRVAMGRAPETGVILDLLPIWHTIQMTLFSGATILEPAADPEQNLWLMEQYAVSHIYGRPPAIQRLLDAQSAHPRTLPSLRLIETSGIALDPNLRRSAARVFGCTVRQAYHLSESSGSGNRTDLGEDDDDSVGYPAPDTEEKIVDPDSERELSTGETGELWIKGPQVVPGYWNRQEATAEAFREGGWLRTGDVARADPRGRVFIVDRVKDLIKVYGHQVPPAEIEAVLAQHPAVREAVVVPIPSRQAGEVPKAFVVVEEGRHVTADELTLLVARQLAAYKVIREIEFVPDLPKSPSGKVLRRAVIDQERARRGATDPRAE